MSSVRSLSSQVYLPFVVGGHDGPRLRLLHGYLEALEVEFAQGTLSEARVVVVAVGLLVVHGKVLQAGARALALHAVDVGGGHMARHYRVFGVILVVASAQHVADEVGPRRQQHVQTVVFHFLSQRGAYLEGSFRIEGCCHRCPGRELGGVVEAAVEIALRSHGQAVRPVGQIHGRDAQAGYVVRPPGRAGKLGVVAYGHAAAYTHAHFFFQRHRLNDFINVVGIQFRLRLHGGYRQAACGQADAHCFDYIFHLSYHF